MCPAPSGGADAVAGSRLPAYRVRDVRLALLCARDKPVRASMSVSHPQDLALVAGVLAGEDPARERIAERMACVGRMVAARNREFGSPLDAESLGDVVGDVVARVLGKLADYSGQAALESWIYVFCEGELRNAIRRQQRRRAREVPVDEVVLEQAQAQRVPSPDEDVHLCLQKLVLQDQWIMRQKHFDGLTLEEIAARQAKNLNTVKSRYTRALRMLGLCMQGRTQEEA